MTGTITILSTHYYVDYIVLLADSVYLQNLIEIIILLSSPFIANPGKYIPTNARNGNQTCLSFIVLSTEGRERGGEEGRSEKGLERERKRG